jgi:hypothetical protein
VIYHIQNGHDCQGAGSQECLAVVVARLAERSDSVRATMDGRWQMTGPAEAMSFTARVQLLCRTVDNGRRGLVVRWLVACPLPSSPVTSVVVVCPPVMAFAILLAMLLVVSLGLAAAIGQLVRWSRNIKHGRK